MAGRQVHSQSCLCVFPLDRPFQKLQRPGFIKSTCSSFKALGFVPCSHDLAPRVFVSSLRCCPSSRLPVEAECHALSRLDKYNTLCIYMTGMKVRPQIYSNSKTLLVFGTWTRNFLLEGSKHICLCPNSHAAAVELDNTSAQAENSMKP